jgi:hypothetical protein
MSKPGAQPRACGYLTKVVGLSIGGVAKVLDVDRRLGLLV